MFKDDAGNWSKAINMGETINTNDSESFTYVTPDGKYLFFNSNRVTKINLTVPSHFYGNIFWVKTDIIRRLKETVFIQAKKNIQ